MRHPSQPTLTQLRRFRGFWLLAAFALVIKLVGGIVCSADGVRYLAGADDQRSAIVQAPAADDESGGDCLLGEGGSCHCACAHAAPVPTVVMLGIAPETLAAALPSVLSSHRAERMSSLLRPPIAA